MEGQVFSFVLKNWKYLYAAPGLIACPRLPSLRFPASLFFHSLWPPAAYDSTHCTLTFPPNCCSLRDQGRVGGAFMTLLTPLLPLHHIHHTGLINSMSVYLLTNLCLHTTHLPSCHNIQDSEGQEDLLKLS